MIRLIYFTDPFSFNYIEADTYQQVLEKYSKLNVKKKIVKIYDGIRKRIVFRSSHYDIHERELKQNLDILRYGDFDTKMLQL